MKRGLIIFAFIFVSTILLASGDVSVSGSAVDNHNDKNNYLEDASDINGINLDRLFFTFTTDKSGYLRLFSFLRADSEAYLKIKSGLPDKCRLDFQYVRPVSFDDTSSSNYYPYFDSIYSRRPIFFSLDGDIRRYEGNYNGRVIYRLDNGLQLSGEAKVINHSGGLAMLRGGSFGSAIDFSYPSKKDRESWIRDFASQIDIPIKNATLTIRGEKNNYDISENTWIRQFGGISLNRTLIDDIGSHGSGWNISATILLPLLNDNVLIDGGIITGESKNKPYFAESDFDRLFPSLFWGSSGMIVDSKISSLYANIAISPSENFNISYDASLEREETSSEAYDNPVPLLPPVSAFTEETIFLHNENISVSWAPFKNLNFCGMAGYAKRRYDRFVNYENGDHERSNERFYRFDARSIFQAVRFRLTAKRNDMDATGDFGDRFRRSDLISLLSTIKASKNFDMKLRIDDRIISDKVSFDISPRSYNKLSILSLSLSSNYKLNKKSFFFFEGRYSNTESYYRSLSLNLNPILFIPAGYDVIERNYQFGCGYNPTPKITLNSSLGQITLTGSEALHTRFISGMSDFELSKDISLTVRYYYSGFKKKLYSFDNYDGNHFQVGMTWRF